MAQKSNFTRKTFYEVVFQGKPKMIRAFLSGLTMGADIDATVFYSYTDGIHHEGKAEKFAELVHLRAIDCHVVVDSAVNAMLKKLAKRIKAEIGLEVASQKRIKSAGLKFSYHAYAKRYNDEIVALIKNLPKGLKVEGLKHNVHLDPDAKGIETYSPVHDYESSGEGTVVGPVDLVVAFKKKLEDYPLIQNEDVKLKHA